MWGVQLLLLSLALQGTPAGDAAPAVVILPDGVLYGSYLAGEREARLGGVVLRDDGRWIGEASLGGRLGLVGLGRAADGRVSWQFDLEAAALPRFDLSRSQIFEAADFRVGLMVTSRIGRTAIKVGMHHLSSHLGDEFLLREPEQVRADYTRDALVVGAMRDVSDTVQVYGEVGYSGVVHGGAEPFELQAGLQYLATRAPGATRGPFAGANVRVRQEAAEIPSFDFVLGWAWYARERAHTVRVGFYAHHGRPLQYSFVGGRQTALGFGVWFEQ